MANEIPTFEEMLSQTPTFGLGGLPLSEIHSESAKVLSEIGEFDGLRLAACFAGLLTVPELQSNCIRLEALVHFSLALGRGTRKPSEKLVAKLFTALGEGLLGRMEDPAEDVFVALITTPRGNFRILEGVWETAGFYTQRVVNAVELIPSSPRSNQIRECIYAILRLSDLVCERAGLQAYCMGEETPLQKLPPRVIASVKSLRRHIRFTASELTERGIRIDALGEFGFNPSERAELSADFIGHSNLERFPIIYRNDEFHFVLPTAASVALRRFVLGEIAKWGLTETFSQTLAYEYATLFSRTPLLGDRTGAPMEFKRTKGGLLAGVTTVVDRGMYINLVFFADTLENFDDSGFVGVFPARDNVRLADDVEKWIDFASENARKEPDFKAGLTLIVACGVGRGVYDFTNDNQRENWRSEFVGAADLMTLSWLPDFKPLSLWRVFEAQDRLQEMGVGLHNINGLLNMVGWARSLGGHLVPHSQLPPDFGAGEANSFIVVEQNAVLSVRHEAMATWLPHVVQDIHGQWIKVRKDGLALFKEDDMQPYFISEEKGDTRWPNGVYETDVRSWWVELQTDETCIGHWAYERSKMLKTWLCFAAPVLDAAFPSLPDGPLLWCARFDGDMRDVEGPEGERQFLSVEQASTHIEISVEGSKILLHASKDFELAFFNPTNVAERALVECLVKGSALLAKVELNASDLSAIVGRIVLSDQARQTHAFMARNFRDFVRSSIWPSPILIDTDDSAYIKLGLGWRARDRSQGSEIVGREECTAYLNSVVRMLEDEICTELHSLDRSAVILFALNNHEAAIADQDNWRRTASAVLALHRDKESTLEVIANHQFKLNGVFQASRLMIEFAICECPLTGGKKPGRLQMSRLMAKLLTVTGLGGWSDTIRWEAMEARVRIAPLGDIQANVSFQEEVLEPYGRAGSDLTIEDSVKNYERNLIEVKNTPTTDGGFSPEFWAAYEEQFGATFDLCRKYIDFIEDIGFKKGRAIFKVKRSELLAPVFNGETLDAESAESFLSFLTFRSRSSWREIPKGLNEKDIFPWRYRRQLTVLRRPFIQIDELHDPTIIVAPGLVRDAFAYMFANFHRGDFPRWQLKEKMKRWAGKSRDQIGAEFSKAVADKLNERGWKTETEVRITKLLGKGFDKDYGDIDVLAWNENTRRVLLIECKDVQHRKSDGEIAEQLADFRGELDVDGKPDHLLRHLIRVDLIREHVAELSRFIKFAETPIIESHLVFRNPVPMKFAWQKMKERVSLSIMTDLDHW